jgi:MoxR-like ATPase
MAKVASRRLTLPLAPLLAQFRPGHGALPQIVPDVLASDTAPNDVLAGELRTFAERVMPVVWHPTVFLAEVRFLRHALAHLFRGQDPLPERLARCVTPGETYHVPGLGPAFWAAVVRFVDPEITPPWCPAVERGLVRLGLLAPSSRGVAERFAALQAAWERIRTLAPGLDAAQHAEFLERVARTTGRELAPGQTDPAAFAWAVAPEAIRQAIREVRTRSPLRKRIRGTPADVIAAMTHFQAHAAAGRYETAFEAFHAAIPDPAWEAALPRLDDAYSSALLLADRARLWCEVAAVLRGTFRVHPLELADVVLVAGQAEAEPEPGGFSGFCSDTFAFLGELVVCNTREWMSGQRERYQFVLREPLVELCREVAERYVRPVLNREHGWDLECDARAGRALTSIVKNDFGRGAPYQQVQWVTFYRKSQANKRADAQFFIRVAADGARYGFHLGRTAREAGRQFRQAIQEHGEAVFRALSPGTLLEDIRFWVGDDLATEVPVKSAADLRAWAANKTIAAGGHRDPAEPSLRGDEFPGEVLLTFDRLLPLYACAAEADPRPLLARRAGSPDAPPPYDPTAFHRETYLSEVWLDRVLGLLRLKRQLVLQGVPGTGKTHVARCLARLLTHDHPGCVRLVQFHPAYSYEEFVEGIRVRSVETDGRSEVTYPVEDGVLCAFAAQAAARPSEPHVLVVDELNRGNLPRIFGELLFLLEYRNQAVTLPYSKRSFRLPDNLFLLATMNQLDRSAVALDQALRRRFSFVDMPADAAVLARWLEEHPSADADETFGPRVVRLFEELNRRLARDLGPEKQVGHSFFMVPELDREKLAAVWDHHVRPLLLDYLGGREDRLRDYTPEKLLRTRRQDSEQPA